MIDEHLLGLLDDARAVLLDFDGPVCGVFAGLPASVVAGRLKDLLVAKGVHLPPDVAELDDPLKVLRATPHVAPGLLGLVEAAFMSSELEAVKSAVLTPEIGEVVAAAVDGGRGVVIVSNNSEPAITAVCERARLGGKITGVVGRPAGRPELMKPHPRPVLLACEMAGVTAADAVLVGDSGFDMVAARRAGAHAVGLAGSPAKAAVLRSAGAQALIGDMRQLAATLRSVSDRQARRCGD